jgi:hypothetical protein
MRGPQLSTQVKHDATAHVFGASAAGATEAKDYRDFCADRTDEHAPRTGSERRKAWIRHHLAKIALLEHHQRVSDGRYIDRGRPEMLHIG